MKAVVKAHKRTREVVGRYKSFGEAERENGLPASTMFYKVRSLVPGDYYYRLESEFDPDEDFTGKPNCPVVVRDVKTGQVAWFGCARTASEKLGVSYSYISVSICNGNRMCGRLVAARYGKRIS